MNQKKPKLLISLGMTCQTAHQTKRLATQFPDVFAHTSSFCDWALFRPSSHVQWFGDNIPVFKAHEMQYRRGYPHWPKYNLEFWHSFRKKTEDGKVFDIEATMDREIEKYTYQRDKFLNMDLSEAVFVYSNSQSNIDGVVFGPDETKEYFITEHQVHDVQQALDTFFGHPCHFVVITTEKRSEESARNLQNVISIPNDKTEWKGSDRDWNSAFRKLGLLSTTRQLFQFIRPSL